MAKRILKISGIVLIVLLLAAAALLIFLSITEYRPADVEPAELTATDDFDAKALSPGDEISVLTWNTGYGGLGKDSDFFMDGGKNVRFADRGLVETNLAGIADKIDALSPDFCLLQEVDANSYRTYGIDERLVYAGGYWAYARNFFTRFVPYPIPPIGRVESGVMTVSKAEISDAARIKLPSPFSWPVSMANLKRCLLVTRIPLDGTDKELVLVNLHLEAYDDGEGKAAQTRVLRELIEAEYAAGNYVVAGGDFNQAFPGTLEKYPVKYPELWTPGVLEDDMLPDGWSFVYDDSSPTTRVLNEPYSGSTENTQMFVIDGFIISPNITLRSVDSLDEQFEYTDHNPVLMTAVLEK